MKFKLERVSGDEIDYPAAVGEMKWYPHGDMDEARKYAPYFDQTPEQWFYDRAIIAKRRYKYTQVGNEKIFYGVIEYTIEINTLDDLMKLREWSAEHALIIESDEMKIRIYDSYVD